MRPAIRILAPTALTIKYSIIFKIIVVRSHLIIEEKARNWDKLKIVLMLHLTMQKFQCNANLDPTRWVQVHVYKVVHQSASIQEIASKL